MGSALSQFAAASPPELLIAGVLGLTLAYLLLASLRCAQRAVTPPHRAVAQRAFACRAQPPVAPLTPWPAPAPRPPNHDMDAIPGPWKKALPVLGNLLEVLRPDFHKVLLRWADEYGKPALCSPPPALCPRQRRPRECA